MIAETRQNKYKLLGGNLTIYFVNTVNWRKRNQPDELLKTSQDLIEWGLETATLSNYESEKMRHWARNNKVDAEETLRKAKNLRESLYHAFKDIIAGRKPHENELNKINYMLSEMFTLLHLSYTDNQFNLELEKGDSLDYLIW